MDITEIVMRMSCNRPIMVAIPKLSSNLNQIYKSINTTATATVKNAADEDVELVFDDYMTYEIYQHEDFANNEIWTLLSDEDGVSVYYGKVTKNADADIQLQILKDNKVTVKDTVTKEMVNALDANGEAADADTTYPKLTITGYAVQFDAAATAAEAWVLAENKGVPAP